LVDGATVRVTSKDGAIETGVQITDDVSPGTVAIPHGWGHRGGGVGGIDPGQVAAIPLHQGRAVVHP
ncbi:hypothetical protein C6A85_11490, partial [Mycobacterium sp. ITM-2017-0098]